MSGKKHGILDTIGLVTRHKLDAEIIFDRIVDTFNGDVQKYQKPRFGPSVYFKDGTRLLWVRPSESTRGLRFTYGVVQNGIDSDILNNIIFPCCIYCGENEVFRFNEVKDAVDSICRILNTIREDKYIME